MRKTHAKRKPPPLPPFWTSQSVKSAGHGGDVGYDAGKRIKGRKRHLLVDTLGLVLGVVVTPASTTGTRRRPIAFGPGLGLVHLVAASCGSMAVIPVRRSPDGSRGSARNVWPSKSSNVRTTSLASEVLPHRLGRGTHLCPAGSMRQRRLVRDYETTESSAEAWIYIAMVRIQLRRLA